MGWALAAGCGGGAECALDADCAAGLYCREGDCVFDCTDDADCPAGTACSARGRCAVGCVESKGGVEACDGLDNDCDGDTDESWPELGRVCRHGGCPEGLWVCAEDGSGAVCDGPRPAAADTSCDGLDEDCDGETDEDVEPRACPLQQGVCAGAEQTCQPGGVWSDCDYGPHYSPDDDTCDGRDSDCDGEVDEDGEMLYEPESGAQAGDGLDNNCNGLVDEPGGVMVPIPGHPIWIDAYEMTVFENADCSGVRYGAAGADYPAGWPAADEPAEVELYACSLAGRVPSGHLSWYQARRACQAQGKRLCSSSEYGSACNAGRSTWYPYGQDFVPGACNDALAGSGQPEATGDRQGCTAGNGTFDMSGNLAEWLRDWDEARPGTAHVGGWGYACLFCEAGLQCIPCRPGDEDEREIMLNLIDCHLQQQHPYESFPRDGQRAFIGARCCLGEP